MKPRNCGKTCTSTRLSSPTRRPWKCSRLNANAARAASATLPSAATTATFHVFQIQVPNGVSGLVNSSTKLSTVSCRGMIRAVLRLSTAFTDDETIQTSGNSANTAAGTSSR